MLKTKTAIQFKKFEGEVFAFLSALGVSGYFVINKHVYTEFSPSSIDYTSTFMLIAGIIGFLSILISKLTNPTKPSPNKRNIIQMLGVGFIASIAIGMTVIGQKYTLATNAAILTTLAVVTTIVFSRFILKKSVPRNKLPWVALLVFGVYIAIIGFNSFEPRIGDWIIIGSSLFFGLSNTLTGVVLVDNAPGVARDYRFFAAGILFGIIILLTPANFISNISWYPYVAALFFWLAIMFFNKAVKSIGPSHSIVINNSHIITTMLLGIPLLGERLTLPKTLGAILVLIAIQRISSKK